MNDITLNIEQIPFGTANSRCVIFYETKGDRIHAKNGLYLSQYTQGILGGGAQFYRNKNYLLLTPLKDGKPAEYTVSAKISKIVLKTEYGNCELTFDRAGTLRFMAENLELRVNAKMGFGDVAMMFGNSVRIDIDGANYTMMPVKGSVTVDSHYDLLTYRYTDPTIVFTPDKGKLEINIYDFKSDYITCTDDNITIEKCAEQRMADFEEFCSGLRSTDIGNTIPAYGLWMAENPFPNQPERVYFSDFDSACYPIASEQPVLSLAFSDSGKCYDLINKFFRYVTEDGLVPEKVTAAKNIYQTVSMDLGYAVLMMLELTNPTDEQITDLYDYLSTVDDWWTKKRSDDGGVRFHYFYRFEGNGLASRKFPADPPVSTADLMTRMVLEAKALEMMAKRLGHCEAAEKWHNLAANRLNFLLTRLWDGEQFCIDTGEKLITDNSVLSCYPLLLGKVLPEAIATITAQRLMKVFSAPQIGLKEYADGKYADEVTTALLAVGLNDCGETEKAKTVFNWMSAAMKNHGIRKKMPVDGTITGLSGSMYPPEVCAAIIFCSSKVNRRV